MNDSIIRVRDLGKRYRIGARPRHGLTLGETLANTWKDARQILRGNQRERDAIWAVRDVNFDVKPGEVLGIIGRNGAGKSTLLKILSRVTRPTTGFVELFGRSASLLEIGTGFHPELTGRENIFLNGIILGMTKREVAQRFDEIVAFSEIETFLDTPVKRYSSGMFVRLAFAVAAYLRPDILIVDEVLAVGDFAFQRKCLGRLDDLANTGRTVLFVSHNMDAVRRLCSRCIVMRDGRIAFEGTAPDALRSYLSTDRAEEGHFDLSRSANRSGAVKLDSLRILSAAGTTTGRVELSESWTVELVVTVRDSASEAVITLGILTDDGIPVHTTYVPPRDLPTGRWLIRFQRPPFILAEGKYLLTASVGVRGQIIEYHPDAGMLDVIAPEAQPSTIRDTSSSSGFILDPMHHTVEPLPEDPAPDDSRDR